MPTKPEAKKKSGESSDDGAFDHVLRTMLGTPRQIPKYLVTPMKKAGSVRTDPAKKASAKKT
jgi:hypothetical protein